MKLVSHWGEPYRVAAICLVGLAAFTGSRGTAAGVVVALALVFLLSRSSPASSLVADGDAVVARFALRPNERIRLADIAAVEVRRRTWASRYWTPMTYLAIFRRGVPGVIEIDALSEDAEPFVVALAQRAKRAGGAPVVAFGVPRRQLAFDLLPLAAPLALTAAYPGHVSVPALALGVATFVLASAFSWVRYAKLSREIAAGRTPAALETWSRLLGAR